MESQIFYFINILMPTAPPKFGLLKMIKEKLSKKKKKIKEKSVIFYIQSTLNATLFTNLVFFLK